VRAPSHTVRALSRGRGAVALWLALACVALAVACGDDDSAATDAGRAVNAGGAATAFPVAVEDGSGTRVQLARRPERIVSLAAGHTEVLFAIGAGPQVVARDRFSDFPPEARALPALEYSAPDPEAVLAQHPDLVILSTRQQQQLAQLRALGLTVFYAPEPASLVEVYERVRTLGALSGNASAADALAARMRAEIDAIAHVLRDVERGPRVFYELSAGLYTAAPNTFIGSLLTMLKARNIAEGARSAFPQLTAEAVVSADPEVILLTDAAFGVDYASVAARPGWSNISAVRNRRVIAIDPDIVNRPGPRLVEGMHALAAALYPERVQAAR